LEGQTLPLLGWMRRHGQRRFDLDELLAAQLRQSAGATGAA
jgi:hypothetical protein